MDEASDEYQNQTTPNHSIKVFISLSLSSQFPFVFSCLCYGAYKVVENCAGKMETNQGIFFYYIKIKDCILVFAQ